MSVDRLLSYVLILAKFFLAGWVVVLVGASAVAFKKS